MTNQLSDEDKAKMQDALSQTPVEAALQLRQEYEAMLRGESLEPKFKPWPNK